VVVECSQVKRGETIFLGNLNKTRKFTSDFLYGTEMATKGKQN